MYGVVEAAVCGFLRLHETVLLEGVDIDTVGVSRFHLPGQGPQLWPTYDMLEIGPCQPLGGGQAGSALTLWRSVMHT